MPFLDERLFDDRLNYAVGPINGPPLVFLHGVLRRWQDYAGMLAALSSRWQVFALDHRGHGRSRPDEQGKYRVIDYVDDAVAFVNQAVDGPAVVYGHSLGAMVAAAVAAAASDQVSAAVLEDPPYDTMGVNINNTAFGSYFRTLQSTTSQHNTTDSLAAALTEAEFIGSDGQKIRLGDVRDAVALRFSASCLTKIDQRVFDSIVAAQWLDGYDQAAVFSQIRCPTLLLQADFAAGGMLPDDDARRVASAIRNCLHIKLDGIGHSIHATQQEATLRHTNGFLESLDLV